ETGTSPTTTTTTFTPNPALTGLADNTALDLGTFACTEVGGSPCAQVTDYSGFVYDANHHRFLMFGGGHATTMTDTVFAFDLDATLTWSELYPPTPCDRMTADNLDPVAGAWVSGAGGPFPRPVSVHTYDQTAFVPALDQFVLISRLFSGGSCNEVGNDIGGPLASYDLATGDWSFTTAYVTDGATIDATEFDPVSGLIVTLGGSGLGLYDPSTEAYDHAVDAYAGGGLTTSGGDPIGFSELGYANHLVYFPPTDAFWYFDRGGATWELRLDRADPTRSTLDRVATTGPFPPHQEPGYAYDSHARIIGGAVTDDTFYAFDPATATWTSQRVDGGSPGTQAFHALNYDPVNNVFVFVTGYPDGFHTWAYRYRN
ncbi:MAG: hypothetical protein ABMB14_32120, partial [Myxococcota bacterium]